MVIETHMNNSKTEIGEKEVYMHIPRGFHIDNPFKRSTHALKLKRSLHGLKKPHITKEIIKNWIAQIKFYSEQSRSMFNL